MKRRSSSFKFFGSFNGRVNQKVYDMRRILLALLVVLLSLGAASCQTDRKDYLESDLGYKVLQEKLKKENQQLVDIRQGESDFEDISLPEEEVIEPVMPEYNPLDETTISISVQEETIHNVLYIIARNAGLNLIIEPGISLDNRVTISFENAVSSLVVEKLLQAYDLAWEVEDNILYVQRWNDQVFDLDFINVNSEVSSASGGDIFGSALEATEGGGGGSALAGEFTMTSDTGGEFDEDSLYGFILKSVDSIISEEDQFGEGGEGGGDDGEEDTKGYFAIDPISGRLYVRTTPGKLRAVAKMLNNLKAKLSRQVIIDARLLEVSLSDEFQLGIDWNYVANRMMSGNPLTVSWLGRTDVQARGRAENQVLKIDGAFGDDTIDAAIEAMQEFGGVKTLANPHVRAKHSQPALFTSGTSSRYVSEITRETDDEGNVLFTTTTATVFEGVMLGVVAYINDNDVIDMQIFPIQSDVNDNSLVPVEVTASGDRISLPVVEVKNVSTTVRVKSGDTIILGGLIDKDSNKTDDQVPGLGSIPGLGWLFKTRTVNEDVRELVFIMTIRVVQ